MAAALAGTLAAASNAIADDTILTTAAPPALALASAAALTQLEPPPAPDPAAPTTDVRQLLTTLPEGCAKPCSPKPVPLLTDDILRELGELPLIDTVMAPVTRGVTIQTEDGSPAVTFAVKPTKITRGSGLVAIRRF